jgi:hypothetical protein
MSLIGGSLITDENFLAALLRERETCRLLKESFKRQYSIK